MSVATASAPLFDDDYFRPPDDYTWEEPVKDDYPTGYADCPDCCNSDWDEDFPEGSQTQEDMELYYGADDYPSISHVFDDSYRLDDGHHLPQFDSYGRNLDDMR